MLDAARDALERVEAQYRQRAWCRDVLGPALEEEMIKIYEWRREMEDDAAYGEFRRRLGPHWCPKQFKKVEGPIKRTVVIGRKKQTKVAESPKPTSTITSWMEEIPEPLPTRQPQQRELRKIDILAAEQEGIPLPTRQPRAFRLARRTDWVELRREVLGEEAEISVQDDAAEQKGIPLPTQQPQAFRRARRTDWAKLRREVLEQEEKVELVVAEEEVAVVEKQDFGRRVDDGADLDDATFLSHQDWERRLAETPSRRQEQQPAEPTEKEEHSTGIFGTIKTWAAGLWNKVKTLWG